MSLRTFIARGYQRDHRAAPPVNCLLARPSGEFERVPLELLDEGHFEPDGREGIGVLCPSYVARASPEEQLSVVAGLLEQISDIRKTLPEVRVVLLVGLQWGEGEEGESLGRLAEIGRLTARERGVEYVGLSLPGPGKIRTVNAAIRITEHLKLRGLAWIDDDVHLASRCLEHMARRFFDKGCRGAVGATKIPSRRTNLAARILFLLKQHTMPACNYPHACCILVETRVLAGGIPDRYVSDDGFVCFELLNPALENPLEYLELVTAARCSHYVGGPAGETAKRLRRMLLNHHIFMADYPAPVARYYFTRILFYGLWPLAPWDGEKGFVRGALKWSIKAVYFMWFSKIGVELFLRGLFRRPLREIHWGGYTKYEVPCGGTPASPLHTQSST